MKICVTRRHSPDPKPKICVSPNAKPRRHSVEYRWRWVFWRWPCTFHVHFMLFVQLFPRWQRENQPTQRQIPVEYRLKDSQNIPTCWYLQHKILASRALPNANPRRQVPCVAVEYRLKCNIGRTICVAFAFYLHRDKKPTQSEENA